jgi:hypothetical protein
MDHNYKFLYWDDIDMDEEDVRPPAPKTYSESLEDDE